MEFKLISRAFEKLESTSKRLEKIIILRDFIEKNPKETPIIFDLIAGNYQREIDKRSVGISLKTIFSVISFISGKTDRQIEIEFNKLGDVGEVASKFLKDKKQVSLNKKILELDDILKAFETISNTSGKNNNKIKKEILANLFIYAKENLEYKFLARLLIDDLRIGVSEGVLRESCVNALFPKIIGISQICEKCGTINLNSKSCVNCKTKINEKDQEKLFEKKFKVVEVGTPKGTTSLEEFIGKRDREETLKSILRINPKTSAIKTEEPRQLYNLFLELFEKKYNLIVSFREIIKELNKDLQSAMISEIKLFRPIKSMLGVRTNTVEKSFEVVGKPALLDYKYDGLRVFIHNDKGKVKLYSRNLDDITKQFPEIIDYIKINFSDVSFLLDSECCGYDFEKMEFLPFQLLSRRILTKNVNQVSHIQVVVKTFDILYLNGETIIDKSYKERRDLLENLYIGRAIKQKLNFNINKLNLS